MSGPIFESTAHQVALPYRWPTLRSPARPVLLWHASPKETTNDIFFKKFIDTEPVQLSAK
jgi:hypothetical protein